MIRSLLRSLFVNNHPAARTRRQQRFGHRQFESEHRSVELMEDRTLLSGDSLMTFVGTPAQDNLILRMSSTGEEIELVNADTDVVELSGPAFETRGAVIDTLGGDDSLTIDESNGLIALEEGIQFHAGTGDDRLLFNGTISVDSFFNVGPDEGSISVEHSTPEVQQNLLASNVNQVIDLVPGTVTASAGDSSSEIRLFAGDNTDSDLVGSATTGQMTVDGEESYEFANKSDATVNAGGGADQINLLTDIAGYSGELTVNGGGGDDTLSVNFDGGALASVVHYHGQSQDTAEGDTLEFSGGGEFDVGTFTYLNAHDGSVDYDGSLVNYTGLEPINTVVRTREVVLNFVPINDKAVVNALDKDRFVVNGLLMERTVFKNPSQRLRVNLSGGDDRLFIDSVPQNFSGILMVNGDGGTDTVEIRNDLSLTNTLHLDVENIEATGHAIEMKTALSSAYIFLNGTMTKLSGSIRSHGNLITINGDVLIDGDTTIDAATKSGFSRAGQVVFEATKSLSARATGISLTVTSVPHASGSAGPGPITLPKIVKGSNELLGTLTVAAEGAVIPSDEIRVAGFVRLTGPVQLKQNTTIDVSCSDSNCANGGTILLEDAGIRPFGGDQSLYLDARYTASSSTGDGGAILLGKIEADNANRVSIHANTISTAPSGRSGAIQFGNDAALKELRLDLGQGPDAGGTAILKKTTNVAGNIIVFGGDIVVNGRLEASRITVNSGGVNGAGQIVGELVQQGPLLPALKPGFFSVDTLSVDGDVTLKNDVAFDVDIGQTSLSGKSFDQLFINSGDAQTVTLEAPTLIMRRKGQLPFTGEVIPLIVNQHPQGKIVGTFRNLPEGSELSNGNFNARISYAGGSDNNDVVLTVLAYSPVATGFYESGVAKFTISDDIDHEDPIIISLDPETGDIQLGGSEESDLVFDVEGILRATGNQTNTATISSDIQRLVFDGTGSDERIIIDVTNGLIPVPIEFNAAGGDDQVVIQGETELDSFFQTTAENGSTIRHISGELAQEISISGPASIVDLVPGSVMATTGDGTETLHLTAGLWDEASESGEISTGRLVIDGHVVYEFGSKSTATINAGGGSDQIHLRSDFAGFSGELTINGNDGDDTLTVNFDGGALTSTVNYNGQGQDTETGDTLEFVGGDVFDTATFTYINAHDGSVDHDGSIVNYSGLEPIATSTAYDNVILVMSPSKDKVTFSTTNSSIGELYQLDATYAETTYFRPPKKKLFFDSGRSDSEVILKQLPANPGQELVFHADLGQGTFRFGDPNNPNAPTVNINSSISVDSSTIDVHANIDSRMAGVSGDVRLNGNTVDLSGSIHTDGGNVLLISHQTILHQTVTIDTKKNRSPHPPGNVRFTGGSTELFADSPRLGLTIDTESGPDFPGFGTVDLINLTDGSGSFVGQGSFVDTLIVRGLSDISLPSSIKTSDRIHLQGPVVVEDDSLLDVSSENGDAGEINLDFARVRPNKAGLTLTLDSHYDGSATGSAASGGDIRLGDFDPGPANTLLSLNVRSDTNTSPGTSGEIDFLRRAELHSLYLHPGLRPGDSGVARISSAPVDVVSGVTVLGGNLIVDNKLTANNIQAVATSTGGNGIIDAHFRQAGSGNGVLSPGGIPGTLTIDGNAKLTSADRFVAHVGSPLVLNGGSDSLKLTGLGRAIDLSNAELSLSLLPRLPIAGTRIVLIDNVESSTSVIGTFKNLPEGAIISVGAFNAQISYRDGVDSNDVTLFVLPYSPVVKGFFEGGAVTFSGAENVSSTGQIHLSLDPETGHLQFGRSIDDQLIFDVANIPGAHGDMTSLATLPMAGVQELRINGGAGDNELSIDVSSGFIPVPIVFDGGAGFDSISVTGNPETAVHQEVYSVGPEVHRARLILNDAHDNPLMQIDGINIEPVTSTVASGATRFLGTPDADQITVGVNPDNMAEGQITVGNFEKLNFSNKSEIIVDGSAGEDMINIANFDTGFSGNGRIMVEGDLPESGDRLLLSGTDAVDSFRYEAVYDGSLKRDHGLVRFAGLHTVEFHGIEDVSIDGGPGADRVTVLGVGKIGEDVVDILFDDHVVVEPLGNKAANVQLNHSVPVSLTEFDVITVDMDRGQDLAVIKGSTENDVVDLANGVTVNGQFIGIGSVEDFELNLHEGKDHATVAVLDGGSVIVNGGGPGDADRLLYAVSGDQALGLQDQRITAASGEFLQYNGVSDVELTWLTPADLEVTGHGDNEHWTYRPSRISGEESRSTATLEIAGSETRFELLNQSDVRLMPGGGIDRVDVLGSEVRDEVSLSYTIQNAEPLTAISLTGQSDVFVSTVQTESLGLLTGRGNDVLNVDLLGIASTHDNITFDGGHDLDTLTFQSSDNEGASYFLTGAGSGTALHVTDDGQIVHQLSFTGLEPIIDDSAGKLLIQTEANPAVSAANAVTVSAFDDSTGMIEIDDNESILFSLKDDVTIHAGGGSDTFGISNLSAGFTGRLTIDGGQPAGEDKLILSGTSEDDLFEYATHNPPHSGSFSLDGRLLVFEGIEDIAVNGLEGRDEINALANGHPDVPPNPLGDGSGDFWRFNNGSDDVIIAAAYASNGADLKVTLFGADGVTILGEDDNDGPGLNPVVVAKAQASDDNVFVKVDNAGLATYGEYTVFVGSANSENTTHESDIYNDDPDNATPLADALARGSLTPNDVDYFVMDLVEDDMVIVVGNNFGGEDHEPPPLITIVRPDGTTIPLDPSFGKEDDPADDITHASSDGPFVADQSGKHYIKVESVSQDIMDSIYEFGVLRFPGAGAGAPPPHTGSGNAGPAGGFQYTPPCDPSKPYREREPNNTSANANTIQTGIPGCGHTLAPGPNNNVVLKPLGNDDTYVQFDESTPLDLFDIEHVIIDGDGGVDSISVVASDTHDEIIVDFAGMFMNGQAYTFKNNEKINIDAGNGDDLIRTKGAPAIPITIDGGDSEHGDTLRFDGNRFLPILYVDLLTNRITERGHGWELGPVTFESLESVELHGNTSPSGNLPEVRFVGTSFNENFIYTPTSETSATVSVDTEIAEFHVANVQQTRVDAQSDFQSTDDSITVRGSNNRDVFEIRGHHPMVTVDNRLPLLLRAGTVDALHVETLNGDDFVHVTSPSIPGLHVDGGKEPQARDELLLDLAEVAGTRGKIGIGGLQVLLDIKPGASRTSGAVALGYADITGTAGFGEDLTYNHVSEVVVAANGEPLEVIWNSDVRNSVAEVALEEQRGLIIPGGGSGPTFDLTLTADHQVPVLISDASLSNLPKNKLKVTDGIGATEFRASVNGFQQPNHWEFDFVSHSHDDSLTVSAETPGTQFEVVPATNTILLDGLPITFDPEEHLTLKGSSGVDQVLVKDIDPLGNNTLTWTPDGNANGAVLISNIDTSIPIEFRKIDGITVQSNGGFDQLIVDAQQLPDSNNTISMTGQNATGNLTTSVNVDGSIVQFEHNSANKVHIETLTGSGRDNVTVKHGSGVSFDVKHDTFNDGSVLHLISPGSGDQLTIDPAANLLQTANSESIMFGSFDTIQLTGTAPASLNNSVLQIKGSTSDDVLQIVPTGTQSGIFHLFGTPIDFEFDDFVSTLVSLDTGIDRLEVIGDEAINVFDVGIPVLATAPRITTTTGLKLAVPIDINPTDIPESIALNGLGGADKFHVTPSPTTTVAVDGGDPIGFGDTLNVRSGKNSARNHPGPLNDQGAIEVSGAHPVTYIRVEDVLLDNRPVVQSTTVPLGGAAPRVEWQPVINVQSYEIELINLTTNSDPSTITAADSFFVPETPLPLGQYSFRVRGNNDDGSQTDFSDTVTFEVKPQTQVVAPTIFHHGLPVIQWEPVAGAIRYDVWLSKRDVDAPIVLRDQFVTETLYLPAAELPIGTWDVWILPYGDDNFAGTWVNQSFRVATPVKVRGPSGPANHRPTFDWDPVAGAESYDLWVRQLGPEVIDQLIRVENHPETQFTPETDLPLGEFIFWVQPIGGNDFRASWGKGTTFTTNSLPVIQGPVSSTATVDSSITWTAVNGAFAYDLQVFDERNNAVIDEENVAATQYSPDSPFAPGAEYSVQVRTRDAGGTVGNWSSLHRFFTPPDQVTLLNPGGSASTGSVVAGPVTFSWNAVAGAASYEIWVDQIDVASQVVHQTGLETTSFTSPALTGGEFRFWVRAVNAAGIGRIWSSPLDFRVTTAVVIPPPEGDFEVVVLPTVESFNSPEKNDVPSTNDQDQSGLPIANLSEGRRNNSNQNEFEENVSAAMIDTAFAQDVADLLLC